ncbi:MAG: hypothetical protein QMC38_06475, partial [Sinobacterium sp.]
MTPHLQIITLFWRCLVFFLSAHCGINDPDSRIGTSKETVHIGAPKLVNNQGRVVLAEISKSANLPQVAMDISCVNIFSLFLYIM